MSEFDFEGVFDEDYLYFYEDILAPSARREDVEKIVELLELPAGAAILDCPCGHGRIANALAERGFHVTGIDASEFFLDRARADAAERGVDVEYVQGDMRNLPWREPLRRARQLVHELRLLLGRPEQGGAPAVSRRAASRAAS